MTPAKPTKKKAPPRAAAAQRILVTGGAGFIGSNYIHSLFANVPGVEVLNLDKLTYAGDLRNLDGLGDRKAYRFVRGDICDATLVDRTIAGFGPDAIIHFAAESHVDRSIASGGVFIETNVYGTYTMLEAARRNDVPRFIHISTDEVYGSIRKGSFKETDSLNPSSPYSSSKAASDLVALSFHHTYGLNVIVTRCTNNYGPRQHTEKFIPKAITLALQGKPIPIYGSGKNVRDWIYVADHNDAVEVVRRKGKAGEIYNIGGDDERTNLDIAKAVLKATSRPATQMQHVEDRAGHDWRYSLDASKTRALGWKPRMAFDEGLRHTIAHYAGRLTSA